MTVDDIAATADLGKCPIQFNRHAPDFRENFEETAQELSGTCPVAWTDSYDGHWVVSGLDQVFSLARRPGVLSNEADIDGTKRGYQGITIPTRPVRSRGGFLEMDPPEQTDYRSTLNPYLSPAAVARWIPVVDEITRACIDGKIESGSIDFVDDLANIVPAVLTMGLLGLPLHEWVVHCEPAHALVYTPPDSPEMPKVLEGVTASRAKVLEGIKEIRVNPRPGLLHALITATIAGQPTTDTDVGDTASLLIGGGFDTTTALTAHSLSWLSQNPAERERLMGDLDRLLNPATEEFLRFFTPAQGDGRTVAADTEIEGHELKEGDRLWLSWSIANRTESVFANPNQIDFDRRGNRHASFGLGGHRCIGSNVARMLFKRMVTQVFERMPDYVCDRDGAVYYESIGVINGMRKLPATFTPGPRLGAGLEETIAAMQKYSDENRLAESVTGQQ